MGNLGKYVADSFRGMDYGVVKSVELVEHNLRSFWEELNIPIPYWRAKVTFVGGKTVTIPLGVFSCGWCARKMVDWWFYGERRDRRSRAIEAARKAKWEYHVES